MPNPLCQAGGLRLIASSPENALVCSDGRWPLSQPSYDFASVAPFTGLRPNPQNASGPRESGCR